MIKQHQNPTDEPVTGAEDLGENEDGIREFKLGEAAGVSRVEIVFDKDEKEGGKDKTMILVDPSTSQEWSMPYHDPSDRLEESERTKKKTEEEKVLKAAKQTAPLFWREV